MAIRRRVSGDQVLTPANVIEQQEAQARLATRAADTRGIFDPKKDPYPGSTPDTMGIEREDAREVMMALSYGGDQPEPNAMRVQDILVNLRMMNNPGDSVERTYRTRIASPLTGIRAFCVECKGGSPRGVAKCDMVSCPLWSFRMGRNRFRRA
jgi:hypothetical protein